MGFFGKFPSFSLNNLIDVDISCNSLEGVVPWNVIASMSTLEIIDISQNQLTGDVPWQMILHNLVNLVTLNIAENNFEGLISEDTWRIWPKNLRFLDIHGNRFYGELSKAGIDFINYMRRSSKRYVDMRDNKGFVLDLSHITSYSLDLDLSELRLFNNALLDNIPLEVSFLLKLVYLNLSWNNLVGPIPDISSLKKLKFFDISHNQLTGSLSPSLFNLRHLQTFLCSSNMLSGHVSPEYFSRCFHLEKINLSYNKLSISGEFRIFHLPFLNIEDALCLGNIFNDVEVETQCTQIAYLRSRKARLDKRWMHLKPFVIARYYFYMQVGGKQMVFDIATVEFVSTLFTSFETLISEGHRSVKRSHSASNDVNNSSSSSSIISPNNKSNHNPDDLDQIYDEQYQSRLISHMKTNFIFSTDILRNLTTNTNTGSTVYTPLLAPIDDWGSSEFDSEDSYSENNNTSPPSGPIRQTAKTSHLHPPPPPPHSSSSSSSSPRMQLENNGSSSIGPGGGSFGFIRGDSVVEHGISSARAVRMMHSVKDLFDSIEICQAICSYL